MVQTVLPMRARIVNVMEIKFAELFQIESEIRNNNKLLKSYHDY
jgi:hypothetical protein